MCVCGGVDVRFDVLLLLRSSRRAGVFGNEWVVDGVVYGFLECGKYDWVVNFVCDEFFEF